MSPAPSASLHRACAPAPDCLCAPLVMRTPKQDSLFLVAWIGQPKFLVSPETEVPTGMPWALSTAWLRESYRNSGNGPCSWAVWTICSRQEGERLVCLPGNISASVLVFVITALKQVHPSQWKMHLAVCCELSLPWYFLWISYFQRNEHTPSPLGVNTLSAHWNSFWILDQLKNESRMFI